jgi:hypothetical protein
MPISRENMPRRPSNKGGDTPSRRGATFTRRITSQRVRTRARQGRGVGVGVTSGASVAVGDGGGVAPVADPVVPLALGRGETLALGRGDTLPLGRGVMLPLGRAVGRGVAVTGRRVVAGRGVGVGAGVPGMTRSSPALERPARRIGW